MIFFQAIDHSVGLSQPYQCSFSNAQMFWRTWRTSVSVQKNTFKKAFNNFEELSLSNLAEATYLHEGCQEWDHP